MSEISMHIDDRAIAKMIDGLDKKLQLKIMLPALRKGVKAIEKEAKMRAPVKTGLLKNAIKSSAKKGKTADTVVAKAYVKPGKEGKGNPAKYAHLVEFGTSRSAPKPFMRPARDSAGPRAIRITTDEALNNLNKVL